MSEPFETPDRPINLEESTSHELERVVVSDDDGSSSTVAPVWVPKPRPATPQRELLDSPFSSEPVK